MWKAFKAYVEREGGRAERVRKTLEESRRVREESMQTLDELDKQLKQAIIQAREDSGKNANKQG